MTQTHSDEVFQAQQHFWDALQTKDKTAFDVLLAEDFISRSPGQPNQDRTAFINTLTSFPARVLSIGSSDLKINFWNAYAVVRGVQSAQLEFADGKVRENKIAITNIFQQHEGRWLLKRSYAVALD